MQPFRQQVQQLSIMTNGTQDAAFFENGRMKFLQYGTDCAEECSEVTESTVTCLLK